LKIINGTDMNKHVFEIFDEFKLAQNKAQRIRVLQANGTQLLKNLLQATYDPQYQFYFNEMPKEYVPIDTLPGIRPTGLENEWRRLYLFLRGNATADALSETKRMKLFVLFLEGLQKKEAEIVVAMMKKDLGIPHLNAKLIKEAFPELSV